MSVDERGRSAAVALCAATAADVDVQASLERLHLRPTRGSSRRVAVLVAAAVVLVAVGFGWSALNHKTTAPPIAPVPKHGHVRSFDLAVPFTAFVPDGWTQEGHPGAIVNIISPDGPYVGVIIDPAPVPVAGSPAGVGRALTAKTLAEWIAKRPFLVTSAVVETKFAGLPAWQLDVHLRDEVVANQSCDGGPLGCVPLVRVPSVPLPLGPRHGALARVFAVELPSGRIVGIVAGGVSIDELARLLAATGPVLDSIVFDAR